MSYYLTLFYPPSRTGKRIGMYFTAAQVSAAVVGLVSAGFQKMDGLGGLVGFQWMFLLYGLVAVVLGFILLWWLPDRPLPPGEERTPQGWRRWILRSPPILKGEDAVTHYHDLTRVYRRRPWTAKDFVRILKDWRLWPLMVMYFGVVGVGIGIQLYGTVIISATNPNLTGIQLSLLFAPIWIVSAILWSLHAKKRRQLILPPDGPDSYSPGHASVGSIPSPPGSVLQRAGLHPDCRTARDDIRRQPTTPVVAVRRTAHGWVRQVSP